MKGHKYTATTSEGHWTHTIVIHATGCKHAVNWTCGSGDTVEEAVEWALTILDQDNDWPGWKTKISPCAKKIGAIA